MFYSLFMDGPTLAIVLGGTALATFLRCGWADVRRAGGQLLAALLPFAARSRAFDAEALRARLATQVQDIRRDGVLRARPRRIGDAEFDGALAVLEARRQVPRMAEALEEARARRRALADSAARTLLQAAELAPVFGLAGTLISLSKLPVNGIDRGAYMAAIGMAVHATLYGLVTANLLLAPLGRLVERRAAREDAARQQIALWLLGEIELARPHLADMQEAGKAAAQRRAEPVASPSAPAAEAEANRP
ncbi:MAG TPA: MotA/TolQ/ExbB proton channel family protein [Novosphingobium sp.]|nr:MotA/TolQ/ExbB proton channel family protein [Novosphingobium sp.]